MSDLSLRRGEVSESTDLFALLKEAFRATPLGLMLAAFAR